MKMEGEKKMKINNKKGAITSGLIFTAFVAAAIVFAILLYTERKLLASEPKVSVCVATVDIPAGMEINDVTAKQYFEIREIYESAVPKDAYDNLNFVTGKTGVFSIAKGTIVTEGMLEVTEVGSRGMENPVLLGFKVEDIFQAACGILRKGDRVHIYTVNDSGEASLRWENICIEDSFDNSGMRLNVTDEGKATRFNIFMEKNEVEEFYSCLNAGSIRIVKL